jgi:hypothetical protein
MLDPYAREQLRLRHAAGTATRDRRAPGAFPKQGRRGTVVTVTIRGRRL